MIALPAGVQVWPFENKTQERAAAHALLAPRLAEVVRGDYTPHREQLTLAQVCERFLEAKVNIRASTKTGYTRLIALYLKPYFEERKAVTIRSASIACRWRCGTRRADPPHLRAVPQERHGSADRLAELIAMTGDGNNMETLEDAGTSAAERAARKGIKSVA
jgi:hypothetical protein